MIEVEQLTKRYADRTAVDGISFQVSQGEIVGFLGPNGAGKSTTLRMLTGYLSPTAGRVRIGGVDAIADPVSARRLIGYMPESVPLYPEMRVEEYLRYRARLKGVPRRKVAERVGAALELANVQDSRVRIVGQLSKGYRSRVGLADALVADPPLLVLDEPTAGLDPNQIRQVRDLIRDIAGQKTVLVSTHILPEVETTCSRVLIIHRGKLVGEGAPDSLRVRGETGHVLRVEAKGEASRLRTLLSGVSGVREVVDLTPLGEASDWHAARLATDARDDAARDRVAEAVFHTIAEAKLALRGLHREQTSLEDVFARLTVEDRGNGRAAGAHAAPDVPEPEAPGSTTREVPREAAQQDAAGKEA